MAQITNGEAAVSRGFLTIFPWKAQILQTDPRNLANFSAENCEPY